MKNVFPVIIIIIILINYSDKHSSCRSCWCKVKKGDKLIRFDVDWTPFLFVTHLNCVNILSMKHNIE